MSIGYCARCFAAFVLRTATDRLRPSNIRGTRELARSLVTAISCAINRAPSEDLCSRACNTSVCGDGYTCRSGKKGRKGPRGPARDSNLGLPWYHASAISSPLPFSASDFFLRLSFLPCLYQRRALGPARNAAFLPATPDFPRLFFAADGKLMERDKLARGFFVLMDSAAGYANSAGRATCHSERHAAARKC